MTEEQEGKSKFSFVQTEAPPNVRLWDSQMAVAYNKPSWKEEGGRRKEGQGPQARGHRVGSWFLKEGRAVFGKHVSVLP